MSGGTGAELTALQAVLAAEHAAVYGYGVVGGRVGEDRSSEARAAYDAHRARRDALAREVRGLGAEPVAASAGYSVELVETDPAARGRIAPHERGTVLDAMPSRSNASIAIEAGDEDTTVKHATLAAFENAGK